MSDDIKIPEIPEDTPPEETEERSPRKIPVWSSMDAKQKRNASIMFISLALIVFSMVGYRARQANVIQPGTEEKIEKRELSLENKAFEKSLQDVMLQDSKKKDSEIEALKARLDQMGMGNIPGASGTVVGGTDMPKNLDPALLPEPPIARGNPAVDGMSVPLPPTRARGAMAYNAGMDESMKNTGMSAPLPSPAPTEMPQPTLIGEIDSSPVEVTDENKKKTQGEGKNTIYLPPSFVEATLLSGVTAKTSAQAKNEPSPLLFRIKDLAILPNNVKANIKGCFVIAEGVGDLADERVHTRLVTLSCVAKNGESVIDQPVKGWAEDNADGKVGLRGAVVAKMGANIARSALAGFVGGFGEALSSSTMTTAMSTSGIPTAAYTGSGTNDYIKAGSGAGIKSATEDIKKFYLELAQQSIPVIEVLAAKAVTLVFSEGVHLEIKTVNMKGIKGIKR